MPYGGNSTASAFASGGGSSAAAGGSGRPPAEEGEADRLSALFEEEVGPLEAWPPAAADRTVSSSLEAVASEAAAPSAADAGGDAINRGDVAALLQHHPSEQALPRLQDVHDTAESLAGATSAGTADAATLAGSGSAAAMEDPAAAGWPASSIPLAQQRFRSVAAGSRNLNASRATSLSDSVHKALAVQRLSPRLRLHPQDTPAAVHPLSQPTLVPTQVAPLERLLRRPAQAAAVAARRSPTDGTAPQSLPPPPAAAAAAPSLSAVAVTRTASLENVFGGEAAPVTLAQAPGALGQAPGSLGEGPGPLSAAGREAVSGEVGSSAAARDAELSAVAAAAGMAAEVQAAVEVEVEAALAAAAAARAKVKVIPAAAGGAGGGGGGGAGGSASAALSAAKSLRGLALDRLATLPSPPALATTAAVAAVQQRPSRPALHSPRLAPAAPVSAAGPAAASAAAAMAVGNVASLSAKELRMRAQAHMVSEPTAAAATPRPAASGEEVAAADAKAADAADATSGSAVERSPYIDELPSAAVSVSSAAPVEGAQQAAVAVTVTVPSSAVSGSSAAPGLVDKQAAAAVAMEAGRPASAVAGVDGAAAAPSVAAESAAVSAHGPRYCDEGLTHAPPDDEPYLGDRDASLEQATRQRRSSLLAAWSGAWRLAWRPVQPPPPAESQPQSPSVSTDTGTGTSPSSAAAADSAAADGVSPLQAEESLAVGAPRGGGAAELSLDAANTRTPPPPSPPSPAQAAAPATTARQLLQALWGWRLWAPAPPTEAAAPSQAAPASVSRAEAVEASLAASISVGRPAVAEAVSAEPTLPKLPEAAPQAVAAAAPSAPALLPREVLGSIHSAPENLEAGDVLRQQPQVLDPQQQPHPQLEQHAAPGLGAEQAPLTAAAAAAVVSPSTAAAAAAVGPRSLLDLIRSPEALSAASKFASVRAVRGQRLKEQQKAERQKAAADAAVAAAAAGRTAASGPSAAAQPAPDMDLEEGIRRLLAGLPSSSAVPAESQPLRDVRMGPSAAFLVPEQQTQQQRQQRGAGGGHGQGVVGSGREGAAARSKLLQADDWVSQMAAGFSGRGGTSPAEGSAAASSQGVQSYDYTDETAAELEAGGELAEAAAAGGGAGRRSLFGEPQQVLIPPNVTVRQLASLLGVPGPRLEAFLREQLGEEVRSDREEVAPESAELAALEFGRIGIVKQAEGSSPLEPRQPVVTILGHVDHGKTSLLDALRSTNVAAGEAGGITQHIGAFQVTLGAESSNGHASTNPTSTSSTAAAAITFVDTPGHEAFSAMRARGAAVTDVAVLVVAADEGVKPQTREALAHARSAGCPVVVALTKCDKPAARPDYVKAQLAAEGLDLEDFGGSVQVVHTSATTGEGLRELEEALLLQAELMELRAPRDGPASGSVIEARVERGLGPVVTVIVKKGTLRVGDPVVVGTEYGRVRALRTDATDAAASGVQPGQYALVSGLEGLPQAGDQLLVVPDEQRARQLAAARRLRSEEFRRMALAAALHAQRQRETQQLEAEYERRRAQKAERLQALRERKRRTADKLREKADQSRAEQAAAAAGAGGVGAPAAGAAAALGDAAATAGSSAEEVSAAASAAAAAAESLDVPLGPPVAQLNLVVKADVQGSVEAVLAMVEALAVEQQQQAAAEAAAAAATAAAAAAAAAPGAPAGSGGYVAIKVVHSGVGSLTPSDVNLALAAGAHIVLFNTSVSAQLDQAVRSAQAAGVRLLSHNVVYHLMDAIRGEVERAASEGAAGAAAGVGGEARLVEVGEAEVLATFPLSATNKKAVKDGRIAGVRVVSGEVSLSSSELWRVMRGGAVLWEGPATSLRQHRSTVAAVAAGQECGVVLAGGAFSDFQPGDRLVCLRRGGAGGAGGRVAAAVAGAP